MRVTLAVVVLLLSEALASAAPAKLTVSTELRVAHTQYYRIHTDLDRALAEDLGRRMDAMFEEYARRLATFDADRSGDKSDVYLFAKRKNYLDFTGNKMSNAGGVTMPEQRIVAADLENQGRNGLRKTLQHEAFHLFAHGVIHKDLPPWLNEGLAVMFEEGIWTGRMFILGQVPPRRVRQLQYDIANKRLVDFRTLMKVDLSDWNKTLDADRSRGSLNYNQAWAMCHFLVYATENGKPKYRARFLDMLQRIHSGTEPTDAFTQSFSANVEGFQTRFLQWAKTLAADMLSKFSQEDKRFESIDHFRKTLVNGGYQMQYTSGEVKWVTDPDPRIYFRTLDGRGYNPDEMFFEPRSHAPCADLVCQPVGQVKLRTRFHDLPKGQIEHETLVEGGGGGR